MAARRANKRRKKNNTNHCVVQCDNDSNTNHKHPLWNGKHIVQQKSDSKITHTDTRQTRDRDVNEHRLPTNDRAQRRKCSKNKENRRNKTRTSLMLCSPISSDDAAQQGLRCGDVCLQSTENVLRPSACMHIPLEHQCIGI